MRSGRVHSQPSPCMPFMTRGAPLMPSIAMPSAPEIVGFGSNPDFEYSSWYSTMTARSRFKSASFMSAVATATPVVSVDCLSHAEVGLSSPYKRASTSDVASTKSTLSIEAQLTMSEDRNIGIVFSGNCLLILGIITGGSLCTHTTQTTSNGREKTVGYVCN